MTGLELQRVRCVLVMRDGPSRRVGAGGLLIGRQRDCDIVALDPSVSRRHALVRLTGEGAEVVPLGRGTIAVNGKACDRARELAHGDTLDVPGVALTVQLAAQRPDAAGPAMFRIERARGGSFGITHSPFVMGGDDADDLIIKRWPEHAVRLHLAQRELFLEVTSGKATRNGVELEAGALEPLAVGDELVYRKETFVVRQTPSLDATTIVGSAHVLPVRVAIEMLPRGGRVVFTVGDGERAVYLADRRLDLLIALLRPPEGFAAGDFIPDDVVREIVWPRNPAITRPEINMLISRCRKDLVQAGLAGPRLLERSPGGGGTRLSLAPGAVVAVDR